MRNSAETLRTYTISSMPGVSECITLAVRRIDDGVGSQWLTRDVKHGDYLWFSDATGEFTYDDRTEDKSLLLTAGCDVTSIMSMRRWLAKNRPQVDVRVIHNVRMPQDVIFADKWRNYPITLMAKSNVTEGFIVGCLIRELLAGVPDLVLRTMVACGPAPYMDWVEQEVKASSVMRFFKERFFTSVAEAATSGLRFTKLQPTRKFYAPVGTTLLEALENNNVPTVATCRVGVCGCCETRMVSSEYTMSSTMMLTDTEIAEGYVPACSYHLQGDLTLAQSPYTRRYFFRRAI